MVGAGVAPPCAVAPREPIVPPPPRTRLRPTTLTRERRGTTMLAMGREIRDRIVPILEAHWEEFFRSSKRWIRRVVLETVRKLLRCRTPALGCHVYERFHHLQPAKPCSSCPDCPDGIQTPFSDRTHTPNRLCTFRNAAGLAPIRAVPAPEPIHVEVR